MSEAALKGMPKHLGELLVADLAHSRMNLAEMVFNHDKKGYEPRLTREKRDEMIRENMQEARGNVATKPFYSWHASGQRRVESWRHAVDRYNSLVKKYQEIGIQLEPIDITQ